MAELLIKAIDAVHIDPVKDWQGSYKAGHTVFVADDNHLWGRKETLPMFVIIKIPKIPKSKVQKYADPDSGPLEALCRRRIWQIRWADLPQGAKDKLKNSGELIIKATDAYTGSYDYTWTQVKSFFRNLKTSQDETGELV